MKKLIIFVIVLGLVFSIFFINPIEDNLADDNNSIDECSKFVCNLILSEKNKQSIAYKQTGSSIKAIFLK